MLTRHDLYGKSLIGGFVPVGGVAMTQKSWTLFIIVWIERLYMAQHFKNNMAMAAGLATLNVMIEEKLVENSDRLGNDLIHRLNAMSSQYEFLKEARGKGMMIAIEFKQPKSLTLKAAWAMLEAANKGLFCQMITIPLFKEHHILTQVAGHGMNVVKLLPPLNLTSKDCDHIVSAFDKTIADTHQVPGSIWELGKNLASHALKSKKGVNVKIIYLGLLLWLSAYMPILNAHAVVTDYSLKIEPIKAEQSGSVSLDFNSKIELGLSQVFLVSKGDQLSPLTISRGNKQGQMLVAIPALLLAITP